MKIVLGNKVEKLNLISLLEKVNTSPEKFAGEVIKGNHVDIQFCVDGQYSRLMKNQQEIYFHDLSLQEIISLEFTLDLPYEVEITEDTIIPYLCCIWTYKNDDTLESAIVKNMSIKQVIEEAIEHVPPEDIDEEPYDAFYYITEDKEMILIWKDGKLIE